MRIEHLEVSNVRIIARSVLEPAHDTNLIVGPNGSGKTSLLEAISLLTSGHAISTHQISNLIRSGTDDLTVFGRFRLADDETLVVGMERRKSESRLKVNGLEVNRASSVMQKLPVFCIAPTSQSLLSGGPRERRNLLDRTLFHVEHDYLRVWRQYHHALQQRNALLRRQSLGRDLEFWQTQLEVLGNSLDGSRTRCVSLLTAALETGHTEAFTGKIALNYRRGWPKDKSLAQALETTRDNDASSGVTSVGPHRAELMIRVNDQTASAVSSRGQSKIIVSALILAQTSVVKAHSGSAPVLLVDDLGAELGSEARELLASMVVAGEVQTFVTVVEVSQVPANLVPGAMFHVKHGVFERQ